eukprot:TRINITY_DN20448_c0_g1_i2.p1 TRINITY_DN20448_c0_g1~~TRINITY_DN20448_c0_g1_i2.p1  ORF type:complete len:150 (+),score=16.47 TRINITY_DN20448_c0_g1_i2:42-452(+)
MPYTIFMMVGKGDTPVFEAELNTDSQKEDKSQLKHFIIHAAIDNIDDAMWSHPQLFLKNIDRFNEFYVSAYVTPGYMKFLIMQDKEGGESARHFFAETYELYLKILMNPFYAANSRITSPAFRTKINQLLKKYFPG